MLLSVFLASVLKWWKLVFLKFYLPKQNHAYFPLWQLSKWGNCKYVSSALSSGMTNNRNVEPIISQPWLKQRTSYVLDSDKQLCHWPMLKGAVERCSLCIGTRGEDTFQAQKTHFDEKFVLTIAQHPCCGMGTVTSHVLSWVCCGPFSANKLLGGANGNGVIRYSLFPMAHAVAWALSPLTCFPGCIVLTGLPMRC